jgi:CspA family cold shock protein
VHDERHTGYIAKVMAERGFGFIHDDSGGPDVFMHATGLERGLRITELDDGLPVSFDLAPDPRRSQRQRATNVRIDP